MRVISAVQRHFYLNIREYSFKMHKSACEHRDSQNSKLKQILLYNYNQLQHKHSKCEHYFRKNLWEFPNMNRID